MLMETFTRATGKTTKRRATALICILTGLNTKDNGKMTSNMEKETKSGQMELNMRDITSQERKKAVEFSIGQTDPHTMETLKITTSTAKESTNGVTREPTTETGLTIRCKVRASSRGKTAGNMLVITSMIRKRGTVFSPGTTVASTQANGSQASSTESENITTLKERKSTADGRTARDSLGLKKTNT